MMKKPGPAPAANASITITGLKDYLLDRARREPLKPRREVKPVLDAQGRPTGAVIEGKEFPAEDQPILGQVLCNLLAMINTAGMTAGRIRLVAGVMRKIEEAMEAGNDYIAGETALGILRKAVEDNGPGYRLPILDQIIDRIGTGEAGVDEV